jgi:hypothetical protein
VLLLLLLLLVGAAGVYAQKSTKNCRSCLSQRTNLIEPRPAWLAERNGSGQKSW